MERQHPHRDSRLLQSEIQEGGRVLPELVRPRRPEQHRIPSVWQVAFADQLVGRSIRFMRISLLRMMPQLAVCAVAVVGCGLVGPLASRAPATASPVAEPLANASPEINAPQSESPAATDVVTHDAAQACSARLKNIPMVRVRTGEPVVAGAYDVTGDELTRYFVETFDVDAHQSNGSLWWNEPTERLLCVCSTATLVQRRRDQKAIRPTPLHGYLW